MGKIVKAHFRAPLNCAVMPKTKLGKIKLNADRVKPIRIMFQDEAGFGRINTPKYCWTGGKRPTVPCHHIREYQHALGAVNSVSGDSSIWVMPWCNTIRMNIFLDNLSKEYAKEETLMVCDGAPWHKSETLAVPDNIHLIHIPPYTPEMNPIE